MEILQRVVAPARPLTAGDASFRHPEAVASTSGRLDPGLWVGRHADVVVDRPLGSRHRHHPDIVYPVNYGYVPGTRAPDGEQIDAYVLGPDTPITRFARTVVAVVLRSDDIEDKLVVSDRTWSRQEIADQVRFQERFFAASIATRPTGAPLPLRLPAP